MYQIAIITDGLYEQWLDVYDTYREARDHANIINGLQIPSDRAFRTSAEVEYVDPADMGATAEQIEVLMIQESLIDYDDNNFA